MSTYGAPPSYTPSMGMPADNYQPLSRIELSIKCENLLNMDFFSKSDPMVVMFVKRHNQWSELGRTEVIWDNLNPEFVKKFVVDYFFEEIQPIKFQAFDIDAESRDLSKHDFLGEIELTLAEAAQGEIKRPLLGRGGARVVGKSHGNIIIHSEELNAEAANTVFNISARAENVKKQSGLFFSSASNAFLQLAKCNENNKYVTVHRTAPQKNATPRFANFEISAQTLCNGDMHRQIEFSLVHNASNGDLKTLHKFYVTPHELAEGSTTLHDKKTSLHLSSRAEVRPSFVQYLHGGMELNFHVAIDFTASNGEPSTPQSLHYLNHNVPNSYEFAIMNIGGVLEQYDSDKLYPAYGFGARLPPGGQVSHDFALNGNPANPEVQGVQGVINAYKNTLQAVRLYGPTNFSPIIRRVTEHIKAMTRDSPKLYSVLMILTDGIITDMQQTMDAIVEAADQALSIVIVGVGDADFANMEVLDGDDHRLRSPRTGREAARDIVQFVPLNQFKNARGYNLAQFSKEVLHEIPGQVVNFFTARGVVP